MAKIKIPKLSTCIKACKNINAGMLLRAIYGVSESKNAPIRDDRSWAVYTEDQWLEAMGIGEFFSPKMLRNAFNILTHARLIVLEHHPHPFHPGKQNVRWARPMLEIMPPELYEEVMGGTDKTCPDGKVSQCPDEQSQTCPTGQVPIYQGNNQEVIEKDVFSDKLRIISPYNPQDDKRLESKTSKEELLEKFYASWLLDSKDPADPSNPNDELEISEDDQNEPPGPVNIKSSSQPTIWQLKDLWLELAAPEKGKHPWNAAQIRSVRLIKKWCIKAKIDPADLFKEIVPNWTQFAKKMELNTGRRCKKKSPDIEYVYHELNSVFSAYRDLQKERLAKSALPKTQQYQICDYQPWLENAATFECLFPKDFGEI